MQTSASSEEKQHRNDLLAPNALLQEKDKPAS